MPDKKTHQHIGAGCGAAFAAFEAKDQPNVYFWIELIGGALGGYSGGTLPDWLEPALGSWHRGVCHSAAAGTAVFFVRSVLANWANICRENADKCRIMPQVENVQTGEWLPIQRTPLQQAWVEICEFVWRLLAGFLNGLAAGYVSHLILDAGTPRGIPLLTGRAALKI
jgi:membrane-bound metal-dependent hydrolase YbcI (DUF457 family)